jgi:hypothetical protein
MVGALLAIAWVVPFLGFLLWVTAAGGVAVAVYRHRVPEAALTPGMGARIGALCGLLGFGVFAVLLSLELLVTRGSGRFRQMLQQVIEQAGASNSDPHAQEAVQALQSPAGMAFLVTLVLVLMLVAFVLLSSLGGMLGTRLMRRKTPS